MGRFFAQSISPWINLISSVSKKWNRIKNSHIFSELFLESSETCAKKKHLRSFWKNYIRDKYFRNFCRYFFLGIFFFLKWLETWKKNTTNLEKKLSKKSQSISITRTYTWSIKKIKAFKFFLHFSKLKKCKLSNCFFGEVEN